MFDKHNRRSNQNAKKLDNESEEKLLEKIAKIQALLNEVDDNTNSSDSVIEIASSNEENKEPKKYNNSPIPSVRPVTPIKNESDDRDEYYNHFSHYNDNNPFYCLPSTSKGSYSSSLANVFVDTERDMQNETKIENDTNDNDDDNAWVPLTFIEKKPNTFRKRTPPMTYKPPKNVDLSFKTQMERNKREQLLNIKNHRNLYDRSHSPYLENEKRYKTKKRYYFPDMAEKRRKKRKIKEEKRRKQEEEKEAQKLKEKEESIIVNPLALIKQEYNDDDNNDDSDTDNYHNSNNDSDSNDNHHDYKHYNNFAIEKKRKFEEISNNVRNIKKQRLSDDDDEDYEKQEKKWTNREEKIKEEIISEDIKPNVNMLKNLGKNFNACVSIASKLPDEALLPLRFLNVLPIDKIKTENTYSDSSSVNERTSSLKNDISTIVTNILKQETPDDDEQILSKTKEPQKLRKIDFSSELKRFSQKLQKIKYDEERF
ncbi:uncharacterized protein MAL13P1.304-like [Leptopilina boulardi]|uniref:uncharacterized protein MAL13P1.304-like n=1 Tax=Leptopilina boulardi TaxID=63433 RepID=UPI0021F5D976|nr:uncharacterized protein MAL13P1.304-like [Leptopilina boulardi]